jgi:hypothetical protein
MNRLLFGDNLGWLRNKDVFPDESVDMVSRPRCLCRERELKLVRLLSRAGQ